MIIENSHPEFVNSRVEVAHLFLDGHLVQYEHTASALASAALFGGTIMHRTVFETAWVPAPVEQQPLWLVPE